MTLTLEEPWLTWDLGATHRIVSWAVNQPGLVSAAQIIWREVRNADLPKDLDVARWFDAELAARGSLEAVAFLTSRDIRAHHRTDVCIGDQAATCVATVGLSNAEHIGTRLDRSGKDWGTINIAVRTSAALSHSALIEAVSIAAQARTAAVMAVDYRLPTGLATGTGTDCIAVAAPEGDLCYAGMHTEVGEAIGRAVFDAVHAGARDWMTHVRRQGEH